MKRTLSLILSVLLVATTLPVAFASDDIKVELDGKKLEFDVNPKIIDGRTMVPLRKIFEEIGASVKWNSDTRTVLARKNSKTITMTIDSAELQIDKGKTDDEGNPITETVALDVPACIVSGRTLVPVRAISESFGLEVLWDEENRKVTIVSEKEEDDSWKENLCTINLDKMSFDGKGVEIEKNQIKITAGGDYTLTGTLADGNITVSTKEKVKLRLSGANITSDANPCIFVEKADKAYITISEGTQNSLVAKKSEDGAVYSKEKLEIKGNGSLVIESSKGHGIKASDNLSIESGNITINAATDGIHINDTFKMSGGNVEIVAECDGIDSESIVNISGGKINIETNGTPIENEQATEETTQEFPPRGMWMDEADVEFEKSTKGINAEWMMCISGGDIDINSASHAIHCQDEIEITNGIFNISSKYDKGISAHGNLTIGGAETVIDIKKSTEGLESKNVMTINDGTIKVVSTDDAINATGGNSGMMPGGNFGGNGGGNRVPPEGFDGATRPSGNGNFQNGEMPSWENRRPNRDENGQFVPPQMSGEAVEGAPAFGNGEFTFPEGMNPGGFMDSMGRDMKVCLIINGGKFELSGRDDCVDANGNMTINGGIIKAANPTGSFSGNFGVLDADGQISLGENAEIILACSNGNEKSLKTVQNTIIVYCEKQHTEKEQISILDSNGNVVYEYTPGVNFKAALITSKNIKTGEKYVITVGDETFETEILTQSTVIGTQSTTGRGFGNWGNMQ